MSSEKARFEFSKLAAPLGYDLTRCLRDYGLSECYTETATERAFMLYERAVSQYNSLVEDRDMYKKVAEQRLHAAADMADEIVRLQHILEENGIPYA